MRHRPNASSRILLHIDKQLITRWSTGFGRIGSFSFSFCEIWLIDISAPEPAKAGTLASEPAKAGTPAPESARAGNSNRIGIEQFRNIPIKNDRYFLVAFTNRRETEATVRPFHFTLALCIGAQLLCITPRASGQLFERFRAKKSTQPSASNDEAWNFHGIALGCSELSLKKSFPEFSYKDEAPIRRGNAYLTFARHPGWLSNSGGTNVSIAFVNDKLVNINVMWMPDLFDTSLEKLKKVYGTPSDEKKEQLKTPDGRTVENCVVTWHNGTSTIRFEKYCGNVGFSRILYALKD